MSKKIFLLFVLIMICAAMGFAQDEKKAVFNDTGLPKTANSTTKFVPAGWSIESTISGDLNNDGMADAAIVFIEKTGGERTLVIAFKNQKGEFERVSTAKNILECSSCGGMLGGSSNEPDIKIIKGVLIINSLTGSRESTDTTFRFRYDPKATKFALIGYDLVESDRATGASTRTSTNYLTGVQITEEYQYNQKTDKDVKKTTKQTKVSKPTQYIEEVSYDKMDSADTSDGTRLEFKSGSTSTTVEGTVAKGGPDFYVIAGKAGQTMTINVTGLVTFGVAAPDDSFARDDGNKTWSKKLPVNGDYKIKVFSSDSAQSYKLTISIK